MAGWRTLFTRASDLVKKLQVARRELSLEAVIAKLDKYRLLILDDLAYVSKDQAETSVLFELISTRYERRSTLISTARGSLLKRIEVRHDLMRARPHRIFCSPTRRMAPPA